MDKEIALSRRMSKAGGKSRVNSIRIPKSASKANLARVSSNRNLVKDESFDQKAIISGNSSFS